MKQAIIIRSDVKMGKGKACSQIAHASLLAYKKALAMHPSKVKEWELLGAKKVVLKADYSTLMEKLKEAERLGIPYALVRDAGLTQIEPGTITALGLGPDDDERIDKVCGDLKLY